MSFWQEHFYNGTQLRKTLYEPLKYLWSVRVSESASERGYSTGGIVTEGRSRLGSKKASQLTHLYWGAHCSEAAGQHQNLRLQRKRKRLEAEPVEVVSSDDEDNGDEEQGDLALAAVEEALDTTVSDEGVAPSPHEELAKLALPAFQIPHIKIHEGEALYGAMSVGPALEELMRAVVCQKHMKNTQVAELTQMQRKYNWCTNQDV